MHKDVYCGFAVPVKTRVSSLSKGKGMASHLLLHLYNSVRSVKRMPGRVLCLWFYEHTTSSFRPSISFCTPCPPSLEFPVFIFTPTPSVEGFLSPSCAELPAHWVLRAGTSQSASGAAETAPIYADIAQGLKECLLWITNLWVVVVLSVSVLTLTVLLTKLWRVLSLGESPAAAPGG